MALDVDNLCVTDGLYVSLRCDGKLVQDFPFQQSAKGFPWDFHPLSNYQLQHWKPAGCNFFYFEANMVFLPYLNQNDIMR